MGEEYREVRLPRRNLRDFFYEREVMKEPGEEKYMLRALELAGRARGLTRPNPMVGCVIVRRGAVAGEGFHQRAGAPHAEVMAIREAGKETLGADLYVNLEPCCHHGRTPPCTEAIITAGIGRVYAAMEDPNPRVSGRGGGILSRAGIPVTYGLSAESAGRLNETYLKHVRTGLPFVFIKSAVSLDGKTATRTGDSRWITGEEERAVVHDMRNGADAILVGIGTVLADDPRLTTRVPGGKGRNPDRVVMDPLLRIPHRAKVLTQGGEGKTIIVTTGQASGERADKLRELGAEVMVMKKQGQFIDMKELMTIFGKRGVASVMIEGGSEVAASALSAGVVDKVVYFIAPTIIGGKEAPGAVGGEGVSSLRDAISLWDLSYTRVGKSIMVEGYLRNGKN
jgi:diaminohydroxyphosphoribosylaminopyrimidine deaminase/5-amino-6-(5-phosphoribosylamino)uracil reductase